MDKVNYKTSDLPHYLTLDQLKIQHPGLFGKILELSRLERKEASNLVFSQWEVDILKEFGIFESDEIFISEKYILAIRDYLGEDHEFFKKVILDLKSKNLKLYLLVIGFIFGNVKNLNRGEIETLFRLKILFRTLSGEWRFNSTAISILWFYKKKDEVSNLNVLRKKEQ